MTVGADDVAMLAAADNQARQWQWQGKEQMRLVEIKSLCQATLLHDNWKRCAPTACTKFSKLLGISKSEPGRIAKDTDIIDMKEILCLGLVRLLCSLQQVPSSSRGTWWMWLTRVIQAVQPGLIPAYSVQVPTFATLLAAAEQLSHQHQLGLQQG